MIKKTTRLRNNPLLRRLVRENTLSMDDIVYPIFIVEGEGIREEIVSMKNQYHFSVDMLIKELPLLIKAGIHHLLLFGTPDKKDMEGTPAYTENGIVQQAIRSIKESGYAINVITDICLCQYKSDGHCCVFHEDGHINSEKTLEILGKIALSHVEAGADMIAPSDMMDGRIGFMRKVLDEAGFSHIPIMSYSAKYASAYYGPFREAAHSAPAFGDRKAYQMDPANSREAIKEMMIDIEEGADLLMVKPGMPYLDIIRQAKDNFNVPIAAYQVSGEYAMLRNAVDGQVVSKQAIYESLLCLKRGGADIIITYFAKDIQGLIKEIE